MRVHVHLAHGFGQEGWKQRFDTKRLVGINEPDPYGYRHAEGMGATLSFSRDHAEGGLAKLHRLGWRWLLGFDLVHALRNRRAILAAEVIWTHTESQFLAISLLFALLRIPMPRRPKLIGQSVWLIDEWPRLPARCRWLWRRLVARTDVLTFLSPDNLARARALFPGKRAELVLFGIRPDPVLPPGPRSDAAPLHLIAVGNDRQRDWRTLIEAVRGRPDWHLRIVSTRCPAELAAGAGNVEIAGVADNDQLIALYRGADIAIIPLQPNLHASGITALEEAAVCGVPMIASDTGGLRAYFDESAVRYVPPRDAPALTAAIAQLAGEPGARAALAVQAQARMGPDGLSSEAFVRRHMELSRELLQG